MVAFAKAHAGGSDAYIWKSSRTALIYERKVGADVRGEACRVQRRVGLEKWLLFSCADQRLEDL